MKISIIGGNSFLGKSLIDAILDNTTKKVEIEVFDKNYSSPHPSVSFVGIDLLSRRSSEILFTNGRPDIIIDLIGSTQGVPQGYYESLVNLPVVTGSICDALEGFGFKGRFLYISSTKILSNNYFHRFHHDISESIIKDASKKVGFKLSILRIPNVVGKRESPDGDMINNIIERILLGSDVTLPAKSSKIDFIYITDVIGAIIALLKSGDAEFQNTNNLFGNLVVLEKICKNILTEIGYGKIEYIDTSTNSPYISEDSFRQDFKIPKTGITKKLIKELVKFRKDVLIKKGFVENLEV